MTPRLRLTLTLASATAALAVFASSAAAQTASAAPSAHPCPGANAESATLSGPAYELSLLCLINLERTANGLGAVTLNPTLRIAAAGHSQAMVANRFFAHESPTGSTPLQRVIESGYTRSARRWTFGENLGWGRGPDGTPRRIVEAWMASPPHRYNLLLPRYKEIGIAAIPGTPVEASDSTGITVTTEYGWRGGKKSKKTKKRKKKKKKRRS